MPKLLRFIGSFHFLKGLLISSSAFSALILCYFFLELNIGIGMAFGVLVVSMSDITGLRRQRIGGMFIALLLGVFNYVMTQLSMNTPWLLYPVTAFCVFISSYISIYGFRASLVSFASLLGIAVSFARPVSLDQVDNFTLYFVLGGFWYMGIALLIDLLTPTILRNELLKKTISKTANLLKENIRIIVDAEDKSDRQEMNKWQLELTDLHEQLRNELLIKETLQGIRGEQRKQLLITAELIDLFELIVSQMPDQTYHKENSRLYRYAQDCIGKYLENSVHRLQRLVKDQDDDSATISRSNELNKRAELAIENFKEEGPITVNTEAVFYLRSLQNYATEVDNKLDCIERFVTDSAAQNISAEISEKEKFLTRQSYEPFFFKEHLSLKSPIFRHSIRIVFSILMAMFIGQYFHIPQTYWILLTIFVIMRPAYALTKLRSKQRTTGTLLGAVLAGAIFYIFRDQTFLIVATFITLTLAFAFVQQNYKVSATFVTIGIILIYILMTSDAYEVIGYRILDTLIGAALALVTNYLILPFWEYNQIREIVQEYIRTADQYIDEISKTYREKEATGNEYRLARKEVFLVMSQLEAALQRHLQEPPSQQKSIKSLQDLVSKAQSLLSASAALGTYIQIHQTTEASVHFDTYIKYTRNNLREGLNLLSSEKVSPEVPPETIEEARDALTVHYYVLKDKLKRMLSRGEIIVKDQFQEEVQEARIISGQLEWVYQLSSRFRADLENYLRETTKS